MDELVAILWQSRYYGLPGYGHRRCAGKEAIIREGRYVTSGRVPWDFVVCHVCHQPLSRRETQKQSDQPGTPER
jgi:hypothetical protein